MVKIRTAFSTVPNESLYKKYLTVADVEKITGLQSITCKETALTMEFYNRANEKILEVSFNSPHFYKNEVEKNHAFYVAISGIGERAALAIPNTPYRITILQGKFCIMIQTLLEGGKTLLNKEQLIAIGKIITKRLSN